MPATLEKPKTKPARLYESVSGRGAGRVDVAAGIIYGVKLVGMESKNTGRTIGLDAREFGDAVNQPYSYSAEALRNAIPMYEGAAVRIDHPQSEIDPSGKRVVKSRSRSLLATSGKVRNVRFKEDGLYGDIHVMLSHPNAGFILEFADKMPEHIAASHNAYGLPELVGDRIIINEIIEVYSVDLVGDKPGTTNGLFEDYAGTHTMPRTISQVIESVPANAKYRKFFGRKLLEMGVGGGQFGAMPLAVDGGLGADDQLSEAFNALIMAILKENGLDLNGRKKKIMAALKLGDELMGNVNAGGMQEGEGSGGDAGNPFKEGGDGAKKESDKGSGEGSASASTSKSESSDEEDDEYLEESDMATSEAGKKLLEDVAELKKKTANAEAEAAQLKAEKAARSLLETEGREATDVRIAAVAREPEATRKALVESWPKREEKPTGREKPATSAPLMETQGSGEQAADADEFVRRLKRR